MNKLTREEALRRWKSAKGASTTVNMVRNKADMFICENVNCSPNIAQILYCQRTF